MPSLTAVITQAKDNLTSASTVLHNITNEFLSVAHQLEERKKELEELEQGLKAREEELEKRTREVDQRETLCEAREQKLKQTEMDGEPSPAISKFPIAERVGDDKVHLTVGSKQGISFLQSLYSIINLFLTLFQVGDTTPLQNQTFTSSKTLTSPR